MKIIFEKKFLKQIEKIKKFDEKLSKKIFYWSYGLENRPNIKNCKKLTNFSPEYRVRIWDYRIFFDISDDEIIIQDIKHRKDAYK